MSLFERVVEALFGNSAAKAGVADQALVDDTIDAFIETVEPRLKLRSDCRGRLAGDARGAIAYLRELGQRMPSQPVLLSRAAWADEPYVRIVFAAAADVPQVIGRSEELRRFFDEHPGCDEAHALLAMRREERHVFAPHLEGEVLRQDVQQTTIGFSDHRLVAPAEDFAKVRLEVGRRILMRLAELVLERVVAIGERARALGEDKAMLAVRLRMLQRGRDGTQSMVQDRAGIERQIREVEQALKARATEFAETKGSLANLDGYLEQIHAVLGHPQDHMALVSVPLRVGRTGFVVPPGSSEPADDIGLTELSLGDGLCAAIRLVRVPRAEMPAREDQLAQAARLL